MGERPLPVAILPTLGYLVKLLASPRDGEALGAARAIQRKLSGVGLDLHDFAAHVEGRVAPAAPAPSHRPPDPPPVRPRSRRAEMWRPPVHVELSEGDRAELLSAIVEALADPNLRGWDLLTLRSLRDRLELNEQRPTRRMLDRAEEVFAELRKAA